jgi:hypothetical protein
MSSNIRERLDIRFDLQRKEFMIIFKTDEQARSYRTANLEGRILAGVSLPIVWLPILPSMECIRNSSDGFTIAFNSSMEAADWQKRSVFGITPPSNPKEVYIPHTFEAEKNR